MRLFAFHDFQLLVLALCLGVTGAVLALAAWAGYTARKPPRTIDDLERRNDFEILQAHDTEEKPVVPFLYFVYAGILVWAVGYFIVIGVQGTSF